jgi:hypothetical protein
MAADRRRGIGAVIAMLVVLQLLAGLPAGAESDQAILDRGPVAVHGLPFFPPNLLEALEAEYLVGQTLIQVFFTEEPLVLPSGWRKAPCGQEVLLRVEGQDSPTFCYAEPGDGGYAVFMSFETEDFPWCPWAQAFLRSLRSLRGFTQGPTEAPFPAILDYRY